MPGDVYSASGLDGEKEDHETSNLKECRATKAPGDASPYFHTAIFVVVSGLHWRSPFDLPGMERGWASALPCQRVVLVVK